MTSSPAGVLIGAQRPRVDLGTAPLSRWAADEAVELAAAAGLHLDEWQQYVLRRSLSERGDDPADGWNVRRLALMVPRQNGKGSCIEARELAALFLFGERGIHTAHHGKTVSSAFTRITGLIEANDWLLRQTKQIRKGSGQQEIIMRDGRTLSFTTRTDSAGRGLTGELLIIDEAQEARDEHMEALGPVQSSTGYRAQTWYCGSAGDDDAEVFLRLRDGGGSERAVLLDWSVEEGADLDDPVEQARANPSYGIRLLPQIVVDEREEMSDAGFARERMGVWGSGSGFAVIDPDVWHGLLDADSTLAGTPTFAVDVPPDRKSAVIVAAGVRPDGLGHVEIVERRSGTAWAVDRIAELVRKHKGQVALDPGAPAGGLLVGLQEKRIEPVLVSGREMAQAAAGFLDAATEGQLRHLGDARLAEAVNAGRKKSYGDGGFTWSRRDVETDISPLVAATVALHVSKKPSKRREKTGRAAFA